MKKGEKVVVKISVNRVIGEVNKKWNYALECYYNDGTWHEEKITEQKAKWLISVTKIKYSE